MTPLDNARTLYAEYVGNYDSDALQACIESYRSVIDDPVAKYELAIVILNECKGKQEAYHLLYESAKAGNTDALPVLAEAFDRGDIEGADPECMDDFGYEVAEFLDRSGYVCATFVLGLAEEFMITHSGFGGDWAYMKDCYRRAAASGDIIMSYHYSRILLAEEDYAGAEEAVRETAESGYAPAVALLIVMCWNGWIEGGKKRARLLLRTMERSVRNELREFMIENGEGLIEDWESFIERASSCSNRMTTRVTSLYESVDCE